MANRKPTILLLSFIFSPNIGGVESHLDDLCAYLIKKKYDIRVITYQPIASKLKAASFEKKNFFEIHRINWIKNLFTLFEPYPLLQMLYLIPPILIYSIFYMTKHKKEIDVIQTHGFNMAIIGFFLSMLFKKKFTVNTHVLFYFKKKSLYSKILSFILSKSHAILVLTPNAKKSLEYIGVESKKILIYHQWIDEKLFFPLSQIKSRNNYKLPKDAFVVLFTGRHTKAKGIPSLLSAIEQLKSYKNIHFMVTGSGELSNSVQEAAYKNLQLHFLGKVEKKELPFVYSSADVCVFPSVQVTKMYAEGIPRVMIEALSCGIPVIATKTGGVEEVITKDVGFFVKPDILEVVNVIKSLSKNKETLKQMRKRCITYAKKTFGEKENGKIIEKSFL